jgi:hypothetical protein
MPDDSVFTELYLLTDNSVVMIVVMVIGHKVLEDEDSDNKAIFKYFIVAKINRLLCHAQFPLLASSI